MFPLVLLQTDVNTITQEGYCKRNMIEVFGSGGDKVILTLPAKVIIFYMGLTTIHIR